ncbi:MAG: hypothetical protein ACKOJF_28445, partial [Planctomycetaceae bacterium]
MASSGQSRQSRTSCSTCCNTPRRSSRVAVEAGAFTGSRRGEGRKTGVARGGIAAGPAGRFVAATVGVLTELPSGPGAADPAFAWRFSSQGVGPVGGEARGGAGAPGGGA